MAQPANKQRKQIIRDEKLWMTEAANDARYFEKRLKDAERHNDKILVGRWRTEVNWDHMFAKRRERSMKIQQHKLNR